MRAVLIKCSWLMQVAPYVSQLRRFIKKKKAQAKKKKGKAAESETTCATTDTSTSATATSRPPHVASTACVKVRALCSFHISQ